MGGKHMKGRRGMGRAKVWYEVMTKEKSWMEKSRGVGGWKRSCMMDGWLDGYMVGCMEGWMDRWMELSSGMTAVNKNS